MPFSWSLLLALPLISSQVLAIPLQSQSRPRDLETRAEDIRPLRAAKRTTSIQSRDEGNLFQLRSKLDLHYVDEGSLSDDAPFAATMYIEPKAPAVVLEDFESYLNKVKCTESGILLTFKSSEHSRQAAEIWTMSEFIAVTSHEGCNEDGTRAPYLVSGASFDEQRATAVLSAKSISWARSYKNLEIDFGNNEQHRHANVRRSQFSHSLSKRDVSQDVGFSLINKVLTLGIPDIQETCKRCVGTGTLTLSSGSVKMKPQKSGLLGDLDSIIGDVTSLSDLADFATVNIEANNLGASFEFETQMKFTKSFTFHILGPAGVGIPGFSIDGVFSIGPTFDPVLVASVSLTEPLSFTYGFAMQVPNNSLLSVDIVDPTKSSQSGFSGTTFSALPFALDNTTGAVGFSVAFRPTIELGITVVDKKFDPVNIFADIPKFEGTLALSNNVTAGCAATGTNLLLNTDFDFDLGLGASIDVFGLSINPQLNLFSTKVLPSSTCFNLGGGTTATTTGKAGPTGTGKVGPTGTAGLSPTGSGIGTGTGTGTGGFPLPTGGSGPYSNSTAPLPTGTGAARLRRAQELYFDLGRV